VQGEHVAIRAITFNRTGQLMAVTCADCTIRIWDNVTYSEVARLPHSSTVVSAKWMDDDAGVLALYSDGALMRWTRPASNTPPRAHDVWNGRHLADTVVVTTPEDAPTALAYNGDRIAASFPKFGVYIWTMKQGSWQPQRPIDRQNVTAIEFIDGGAALLGGTKDGVLYVLVDIVGVSNL
jgi:WD40 repeat protein